MAVTGDGELVQIQICETHFANNIKRKKSRTLWKQFQWKTGDKGISDESCHVSKNVSMATCPRRINESGEIRNPICIVCRALNRLQMYQPADANLFGGLRCRDEEGGERGGGTASALCCLFVISFIYLAASPQAAGGIWLMITRVHIRFSPPAHL